MSFTKDQALEAPLVSGVTLDKNVCKVTLLGLPAEPPCLSELFGAVAEKGVNVDIIVHDQDARGAALGFTVASAELRDTLDAVRAFQGKGDFSTLQVDTREGLAKVSAVGLGMMSRPGVAGAVFSTLSRCRIPVLMVSTSEIKISCVVPAELGDRAALELHQTFFPA